MTTENQGDEQRYNPAAGTMPGMPSASNVNERDSREPAAQDIPSYGGAYPPGSPNLYPGGVMPGAPNPGLAALLGFIPGVGAMYNGQFAKGLAHIAIFAVFCSLSNNVNGIFGLLVAGWVLYMAFEAYQTAVARRDGLPLPDPFGLNTVGERFGFRANPNLSSFWGHGAPPPTGAAPQAAAYTQAAPYAQPGSQAAQPGFHVDPAGNVYRHAAADPFAAEMPAGRPVYDPSTYRAAPPAPEVPYGPGYPAAPFGVSPGPMMQPASSRLPAGALWLIGLGVLALLGSVRAFRFLEGESTGGLFLIGLSIFLVWRRWSQGQQLYAPGSPAARWNLVQGMRGAAILFVVGLLTLLQGLRVAYWENSWPLLLIALGVMLLLERFAVDRVAGNAPYVAATPTPQAEPPVSSTSILPRYTRVGDDPTREEGQQP